LYSEAYGVSANGSVVVGAASDRAFRWTADGGMVSLGLLNGGIYSLAFGVNSNGSVVVGYASDGAAGNASRAFRWTETTGMTSLGVLTGSSSSYAYGVNADGTAWRRRGAPFAGRKPPTRKPPAW
jgi:probable HAF family extracellular repeat protein